MFAKLGVIFLSLWDRGVVGSQALSLVAMRPIIVSHVLTLSYDVMFHFLTMRDASVYVPASTNYSLLRAEFRHSLKFLFWICVFWRFASLARAVGSTNSWCGQSYFCC